MKVRVYEGLKTLGAMKKMCNVRSVSFGAKRESYGRVMVKRQGWLFFFRQLQLFMQIFMKFTPWKKVAHRIIICQAVFNLYIRKTL